ncbi:MAG: LPS translocon maturation chaperone LptM [Massilia sp.]
MKSTLAFAFAILAGAALSACGQTGPLYMPKTTARPPIAQPAPPAPIPSTVPDRPSSSNETVPTSH